MSGRPVTRRRALVAGLGAAAGLLAGGTGSARAALSASRGRVRWPFPAPELGWHGESSLAAGRRGADARAFTALDDSPPLAGPLPAERFDDVRRRFVFEYYPWYGRDPWRHWEQWGRQPPLDIASSAVPLLGAYDSGDAAVIERHARWMAESGVGSVNLSWWGPESFEDQKVHLIMDVMRDHDLRVAFHLEPYSIERPIQLTRDLLYIVREYGERRGWDALLVLRGPDGGEGPVFKWFRSVLPSVVVDCHGAPHPVPDFVADDTWAREIEAARRLLRSDFDRLTLLADSTDIGRTWRAGFDGIAVYDNFVPPSSYVGHARAASLRDLVFSFNVNPGFDGIEPRELDPDGCPFGETFAPGGAPIDWRSASGRDQAMRRSGDRILESLETSVNVQSDPSLANGRREFFMAYVNSFNEWHEGHAFEPMRDYGRLSAAERALGYHNVDAGSYRLDVLRWALRAFLERPIATPARA